MVEGPGCKVKGEIMKRRVRGKLILNVRGLNRNTFSSSHETEYSKGNSYEVFVGKTISDVRTLGKELFIFFSNTESCIRLHFLMDGSVRYGLMDKGWKNSSECSLSIVFVNDALSVVKSAVDVRSSKIAIEHCISMADLDICSFDFNFDRAVSKIMQHQDALICDVIMNQDVLPGVGNIIKNEGLFKAGINPTTVVRKLTSQLLFCLVHRLRDFSAVFYKCRRENKTLKTYLCIYEKLCCPQCSNQVTVIKPGKLTRLTFFCSKCQMNSVEDDNISLPTKNSLLGFLSIKTPLRKNDVTERISQCTKCTFSNAPQSLVCHMCRTILSSNKRTVNQMTSDREGSSLQRANILDQSAGAMPNISQPKSEINVSSSSSLLKKILPAAPVCREHLKQCFTRTVHRAGENKGRLFYCCSLPRKKQCDFFQWADLHHPTCEHGKVTIVRRVLKQNENNGKQFYCCPLPPNKQCGFFQWF